MPVGFSNLALEAAMTAALSGAGDSLVIYGTEGNDLLIVPPSEIPRAPDSYTVYGLGGDDVLRASYGNDQLYGGDGNDLLYGGGGKGLYGGDGNDTIYSGIFSDPTGVLIGDDIDGGGGIDTWDVGTTSNLFDARVDGNSVYLAAKSGFGAPSLFAVNVEIIKFVDRTFTIDDLREKTIRGTDGDDTLKAPNDGLWKLAGGLGNDTYQIANGNDTVSEAAGEGRDRVISTTSHTLADNVENLQLIFNGNTSGVGNALANYIGGNSGNNAIDGRDGADTLVGGAGADTFLFRAGEADGDTVADFTLDDTLSFLGYGSGTLTQIGSSDRYLVTSEDLNTLEIVKVSGVLDLLSNAYEGHVLFA